jgi:hypothetical protein
MRAAVVPVSNPALSVSAWSVNASTGSDGNYCTNSSIPCATVGHIFSALFGTNAPALNQATVITVGSSLPVTDSWSGYRPSFGPNGSLSVQCTLPSSFVAATIGTFTPPNYTAGTLGTITASGQSGSYWSTACGSACTAANTPYPNCTAAGVGSCKGAYILDPAVGGYFSVVADLGSATAQIDQPRTTPDYPVGSFPGSYVTVANGDALQIYPLGTLQNVYVGDTASAGASGLSFQRCCLVGAGSFGTLLVHTGTIISESQIIASVVTDNSVTATIVLVGDFFTNSSIRFGYSQLELASGIVYGGWSDGVAPTLGGGAYLVLDGDAVFPYRIHWTPGGSVNFARAYLGQTNDPDSNPEGSFTIYSSNYGSSRLWGPAGWLASNNRLVNSIPQPFAAGVLLTGSPTMFGCGNSSPSTTGWYFQPDSGTFASEVMTWAGVDTRGGYVNPCAIPDGISNQSTQ